MGASADDSASISETDITNFRGIMNWIKTRIMSYVISGLFESKYGKLIFGWANGHKTQIGMWLGFIGAVLTMLPQYFNIPYITEITANYTLVAGWICAQLGLAHKAIKQ